MVHIPGCEGGEILFSDNRTLAPVELVQASHDLDGREAKRIYDYFETWCTDSDDSDPYIDMEFTEPILITMMISSGTILNSMSRLRMFYVTNFTLEYSPLGNSSFLTYYTSTAESEDPMVSEIFPVQYIAISYHSKLL